MKLEIGKTYLTRDGGRVTVEAETSNELKTCVMRCVDELGRVTWRSKKGRFSSKPTHLDLVKEAE